jgi:cytochrome c oxidase subunit II
MKPGRKALVVLVPLLLFLSACASDAPQDTLEPEGPIARKIDNLVNPVFIVAAVVFVLVEFGALYLALKFRQRKDDDPDELPGQTHGNTKLEIGWTVLPALLLGFVAFATLATLFDINDTEDDLTVQVTGQQWWWEFTYDTDGDGEFTDDDLVTANDLVVPAGQNVGLEVTSRDVIHSFWIPKLNGKKDAVPGRTHPLTINADEPGTYVGQCTEYCGLSHAYMRQRVVALPPDEFEAWLEDQQAEADEPTDEKAQSVTWPGASTTRSSRTGATVRRSWCPRTRPTSRTSPLGGRSPAPRLTSGTIWTATTSSRPTRSAPRTAASSTPGTSRPGCAIRRGRSRWIRSPRSRSKPVSRVAACPT